MLINKTVSARNPGLFIIILVMWSVEVSAQPPYPASNVPAPSSDRSIRFGVYNWNADLTSCPAPCSDPLNWGAGKVISLGSKTIRIYIGPQNIYKLPSFPNPDDPDPQRDYLVRVAQLPAYQTLFSNNNFKTIILTTSTRNTEGFVDGYPAAEYSDDREEIKKLGQHLISTYLSTSPDKTFVITDGGGEKAFGHRERSTVWDYYVQWVNARADGVSDAKSGSPTARLYSGMEFQDAGAGAANPPASRTVLGYVAPKVKVDYYLFLAWITPWQPYSTFQAVFNGILNTIARPGISGKHLIIGESESERILYGDCGVSNQVKQIFSNVETWSYNGSQLSYSIWWQIVDDPPYADFGFWGDWGLYKRDGKLSLGGLTFKNQIAGVTTPQYTCPAVSSFNSGEYPIATNRSGDTPMVISGSNFSASSSLVRLRDFFARDKAYDIREPGNPVWSVTVNQIQSPLPVVRREGLYLVNVVNPNAITLPDNSTIDLVSNGNAIRATCSFCPQISVGWRNYEADYFYGIVNPLDGYSIYFNPGSIMAIFGTNFSSAGNKVVITRADPLNERYELTSGSSNWYESTGQINATIPQATGEDLSPRFYRSKPYLINVVDVNGRESATSVLVDYSLYDPNPRCPSRDRYANRPSTVVLRCQSCVEIKAILSYPNYDGTFQQGGYMILFGNNMPTSGTIYVEQTVNGVLQRYQASVAYWSSTQINAIAPAQLIQGNAYAYVVDTQGRETNPVLISIQQQPYTCVGPSVPAPFELSEQMLMEPSGFRRDTVVHPAVTGGGRLRNIPSRAGITR